VTTLAAVRRMLAVILLIGMAGTTIELLLLKHDEDAWQIVPLVLLGAGLVTVLWRMLSGSRASALVLRVLMVLFLAAGVAGIVLHYLANVEFQRETDPALSGRALLWSVLQAKVPPALSPGVMVQLALVGLAYTYRHKEH
jgi:hypothetical protein